MTYGLSRDENGKERPHCGTCVHWTRDTRGEWPRFGTCDSDFILRGYHVDGREASSLAIIVEDDEGWGIYVGEHFGCCHHVEKPKAE